jgi:N-acetylmuramoyl-L-alanine amidase
MYRRAIVIPLIVILLFLSPGGYFTAHAEEANSVKGVSHTVLSKRDQVVIYLDRQAEYEVLTYDPCKVVINLKNTLSLSFGERRIDVNSALISTVRFAQFDNTAVIARVVVDLKNAYKYEISANGRNLIIYVYPEVRTSPPQGGTNSGTGTIGNNNEGQGQTGSGGQNTGPGNDLSDRGGEDRQGDEKVNINFTRSSLKDTVEIGIDGYSSYNVMRISDPDRVVVDFEDVPLLSQRTVNVNGKFVKDIRYAAFDSDTARVVLDLTGQHNYSYIEENGKLVLTVDKTPFNYLKYHNNTNNINLEIEGVKLSSSTDSRESFYECWFDSTRKNMHVSFPSNGRNFGNGEILINDGYLRSIRVMSGSTTTTLIFMAKDRFKYNIEPASQANSTLVSIIKPSSGKTVAGELVVIDAGHGGSECGAVYGSIYEKDLNLDIAIRLNNLLVMKGISTYMIRKTDVDVPYQIRGKIANDLNASLYISIHNNGSTNKSARGTETLCYSKTSGSGFTGYDFAQIVHKHLISTLGTRDRGIIERPNLAVLNSTVMPSVLAEIAYMSNSDDLNLLKQPAFRQKAAQALCDAVLEALEIQRQLK